ncbi:crossover junction endonuclease MUS81-like isoform X1 [Panicum virgatum]|uniref:Crossover junction endonuclease MUS81 n=1 Tax=Panicum virgatum TaxID=38727 RepID=A0A8T0SUL2_PANVG|nr:crossover junction endonuclease MUS81-like isoform X1 [Panicum virgatum]KAG2603282.1 hypothetical protein PVAP13_5KG760300 [Panicum virgatum]
MAPPAPMQLKVRLPENEEVARALHEKRLAMREQPSGFKEHLDRTFGKAYHNVCAATEPIRTLKDFSKIKGVGPWLIRCMKGFFAESSQDLSPAKRNVAGENGKKPRGPKRCVPKKKTAASGSPGKEAPANLNCQIALSLPPCQGTLDLQSAGKMDSAEFNVLDKNSVLTDHSILAMPPHQSNEEFLEAYEVVLILDDRENFGSRSRKVASRKVADNICSQFNVSVEVKRLPVGDGIWIARHRKFLTEYVLDFIVERKNVADLGSSIRDNRYKDQKSRLQNCGLRKLIYLVEGDPNTANGSVASIKTACFTTELFEGFDVLRTTGYTDTQRTYGYLTQSIIDYYSTNFCSLAKSDRICPTYDEFEGNCRSLQKKTVSQIFALQLMQVPQVTEKVALAVIEFYPTLLSLARAYSMLEGDICSQEEMLKNKSKVINAGASRNIFKLVWGDGCNLQA